MVQIEIPKGLVGEFNLRITLSDESSTDRIEEKLDLGKLTGFAISESNRRTLSLLGIIMVSLIALFFLSKFVYSIYRKVKFNKLRNSVKNSIEEKHGRRLIKLNFSHHH